MRGLSLGGRRAWPWERWAGWACIALCLGLFAVYVHVLDRQALWWDEGSSIYKALLSPAGLLRLVSVTDDHPPGYYLLLRGWMTLLGPSPFGVRLMSVFAALCLAPLLYVLGKRLDGRGWTGLAAAVMGGLLPYVIQHARESRMYPLEMALAAASTYAFLRLLAVSGEQRRWGAPHRWWVSHRWWVAYAGVSIVGLHIHYAFALLCAAQGVAVLVAWGLKKVRLKGWLIAGGVVAAAYVPWLGFTEPRLQSLLTGHLAGAHGPRLDWPALLPAVQQGFLNTLPADWSLWVLAGLALAALTGGAMVMRRQPAAAVCLTVGVAEAALLIVVLQRQEVNAALLAVRQVFFSVPLVMCLAAVGLRAWTTVWRWAGWAAAGFIIFSLGWNVPAFYHLPADPAEDYRPLVAQAAAIYRPGDAVWTNYDWQEGYFDSYAPRLPFAYYRGVAPTSTVTDTLESLFAQHPHLWVVNYQVDVNDLVDYPFNAWLHAHALLAFESWYGKSHLALFARAPEPPSVWPAQAAFENGITLNYVPLTSQWKPGDLLTLSLRWQSAAPPSRPYSVFIHVRHPDGQPVAQNDYALESLEPSGAWTQGQPAQDQRAVLLPLDVAPGDYGVYVGVYDTQSPNARLNVTQPSGCDLPDSVCLGTIEIAGSEGQP